MMALFKTWRVGDQPLESPLASLRWRRLISLLAAVMRKPAVLSPSAFTCSIASKSSSGSLTDICRDLLFFLPVAITVPLGFKCLRWCSPVVIVVFTLAYLRCKNSEAPKVVATPTGLLTNNVKEANAMAKPKCTQTRPEFATHLLLQGVAA